MRKFAVVKSVEEVKMTDIQTFITTKHSNESADLVEASYMNVKDGAVCFYRIGNHVDLMVALYSISKIVKVLELEDSGDRGTDDKPILRPAAFARS